jgi:hypothetical protein
MSDVDGSDLESPMKVFLTLILGVSLCKEQFLHVWVVYSRDPMAMKMHRHLNQVKIYLMHKILIRILC